MIKAATNDVNDIAKDRINQIISQGGKEVECALLKILRGGIEDVYQMPFRLLSNLESNNGTKQKERYYVKILLSILIVYTQT